MAAALWKVGTSNAINTTLNGNVAAGDTTITLTSVTGLQAPGVLVIDRQDINNADTPALREYVSFTGISSSNITGVTRALGGSTAQSHSSSAKVEEVFSITHWNDLISAITNVLTAAGIVDVTKIVDLASAQSLTNKTLSSGVLTGTFTGSPTLSGAVALSGGGSMAGTFSGSPIFSGKPVITASSPVLTTDADAATVTFNMNTSNVHTVTLAGNRTLATSNVATPQFFCLILKQDGTGSRTVTWFANILWAGATAPTLTTTAGRYDIFTFLYDGTNYYGSIAGQNYG